MIPQIVSPVAPNKMRAIPEAFRIAAIVAVADFVVIRRYHSEPRSMSDIAILRQFAFLQR
jgi:hypothetical protein